MVSTTQAGLRSSELTSVATPTRAGRFTADCWPGRGDFEDLVEAVVLARPPRLGLALGLGLMLGLMLKLGLGVGVGLGEELVLGLGVGVGLVVPPLPWHLFLPLPGNPAKPTNPWW